MTIIVINVDIRMFLEWENNSGKLQIISGKFQNNAINDIKQIPLSHVINPWINLILESKMFDFKIGLFHGLM